MARVFEFNKEHLVDVLCDLPSLHIKGEYDPVTNKVAVEVLADDLAEAIIDGLKGAGREW